MLKKIKVALGKLNLTLWKNILRSLLISWKCSIIHCLRPIASISVTQINQADQMELYATKEGLASLRPLAGSKLRCSAPDRPRACSPPTPSSSATCDGGNWVVWTLSLYWQCHVRPAVDLEKFRQVTLMILWGNADSTWLTVLVWHRLTLELFSILFAVSSRGRFILNINLPVRLGEVGGTCSYLAKGL